MPLSHDEVVHMKGSLFSKMPGDDWQKMANLRALLAYMFTRPGKKLVFMGTELAPWSEWHHDASLDWHLLEDPQRAAFCRFVAALATLYKNEPAFWREDPSWDGFSWIDVADRDNSVISYLRRASTNRSDRDQVLMVLNLTPVPRESYRIGVPFPGRYRKLLSSDDAQWGGSGFGAFEYEDTEAIPFHGHAQSIRVMLPPLGALVLAHVGD
jgi:1,4-alpha-glucan branching enzyme